MSMPKWCGTSPFIRIVTRRVVMIAMAAAWLTALVSVSHALDALSTNLQQIDASKFPNVTCVATVTDADGMSVAGLTRDDFTLSENGESVDAVQVHLTLPGKERIAVVLVVDRSGSMKGHPLDSARAAASDFAGRISDQDLLGVITFASKVDPGSKITTDHEAAIDQLKQVRAKGETAFLDAVAAGVRLLSETKADRKALVVLTDGQDNASSLTADACLAKVAKMGIPVYCIGLGKAANRPALEQLAKSAGGAAFFTDSPDDLQGIYARIASQIQHRYILTYSSPEPSSANPWRTVQVGVKYKGTEAESMRQYVVSTQGSGEPTADHAMRFPPILVGVAAFAVVDLALVGIILRRRLGRA